MCVNCNACHSKCPQNNLPEKKEPLGWYQGWNTNEAIRLNAPSGGIGMALAQQFIKEGGYVCSCLFQNGEFCFDITNDFESVLSFGGSKYVKSNPSGVYSEVLQLLKSGNKVLFIGLPCQVAAIKNYIGQRYEESLVLVDLICHGTPSPKLLEMFLNQYSKGLKIIENIKFRLKEKYQILVNEEGIVCRGVSDKYSIGFIKGLTFTNNCYSCNYASVERVSDITIGDSWGSEIVQEKNRGISLMLVQTQRGMELLKNSDVNLLEVDFAKAIENNAQLKHPMVKSIHRDYFFDNIEKKKLIHLFLGFILRSVLNKI